MTDPRSQTLYVMQNEHGYLKIGRSLNPERRRQTLESTEKCKITLVWVGPNLGHLEEEIHARLAEYRIEGEWFLGDEIIKLEVLNAIDCRDAVVWPFDYNKQSGNVWLETWGNQRDRASIRRSMHRMIDLHILGSEYPDEFIPWFLYHAGVGPCPTWVRVKGQYVQGYKDGRRSIPFPTTYTTSLEVALELFPEDERPETFEGSPWECVQAAMAAWKARY